MVHCCIITECGAPVGFPFDASMGRGTPPVIRSDGVGRIAITLDSSLAS